MEDARLDPCEQLFISDPTEHLPHASLVICLLGGLRHADGSVLVE